MENTPSNSGPGNTPFSAGNPVQRSVESAGVALHSTIDKVAEPTRNTVDRVSSAAHESVDKLASNASHAADQLSDQARWISEVPGRAVECSKSWVQERPLKAVGAALALGFILGRLTAR